MRKFEGKQATAHASNLRRFEGILWRKMNIKFENTAIVWCSFWTHYDGFPFENVCVLCKEDI
jgi:hypothetical protein